MASSFIAGATTVPTNLPLCLTVKQAAELGNCSEKHLRDLLTEKKVLGFKLGNAWRVNRDAYLHQLGLNGEVA